MAKQELPVDFKDDVLQAEMAGKRKYRIIQNEDGTISLEDVTNYSQIGSNFGAAQMNATNLAVNESFDKNKVIDSLADIVANEATGYAAGALAVRELNGNMKKLIIKKTYSNRINVAAGQRSVTYIVIDAIDGYTAIIANVYSSHATTITSDVNIVSNSVRFYFDAKSANTPETFGASVIYLRNDVL